MTQKTDHGAALLEWMDRVVDRLHPAGNAAREHVAALIYENAELRARVDDFAKLCSGRSEIFVAIPDGPTEYNQSDDAYPPICTYHKESIPIVRMAIPPAWRDRLYLETNAIATVNPVEAQWRAVALLHQICRVFALCDPKVAA